MTKLGTGGQLVTCDMWLNKMPSDDELGGIIEVALMDAKINVVDHLEHNFEPQGSTMVWVLSESHIAVHTYPEHNYISLDCYTCGDEGSAYDCVMDILHSLDVRHHQTNEYKRGLFI